MKSKESMLAFYRLIFNMKTHRWKESHELFNELFLKFLADLVVTRKF